jgi:hypothetical protein
MLLAPNERRKRAEEKREAVLRFLREELWTSPQNIGLLLNLNSVQAVHKTIVQLERDSLVRRESVPIIGRCLTLVGITSHGQACAAMPNESVAPHVFEPGRVASRFVHHRLDLQRLRIGAERAGWQWLDGDRVTKWTALSRPDAVTSRPGIKPLAVECERTFKSVKRYQAVLADRLRALRTGAFSRVVWAAPTDADVTKLRSILTSFRHVVIGAQRVPIDPARHHAALDFVSFDSFASYLAALSNDTAALDTPG